MPDAISSALNAGCEKYSFGRFGVGSNVAVSVDATGVALAATVGASMSFPEGITPFVELFGDGRFYPTAKDPQLGADAGMGIQITRSVAVDASAGFVFLGEQTLFASIGASFLWP